MSDNSTGFKVVDKRRFSSDGDSIHDLESPTTSEHDSPTPDAPRTEPSVEQHAPLPPVDFNWFVVSLATQAMVLLGQAPDPQTNKVILHLDGAKHTIDILGILEQKTKGNLTDEEQKLLEDVLANLRITYVKKLREQHSR